MTLGSARRSLSLLERRAKISERNLVSEQNEKWFAALLAEAAFSKQMDVRI